jgi:hypothetical protein
MTEAEWLGCDDPLEMLDCLHGRGPVSDRKERLFACVCCRRIWHLLKDRRSREAVEAAESYVDGCLDGIALDRSAAEADGAVGGISLESEAAEYAATAAARAASWEHMGGTAEPAAVAVALAQSPENWLPAKWDEQVAQCDLLHDIFGNPFRPLPSLPASVLAWNDGCVVKLARAMYEGREFTQERMGVLADALEDAGCADAALLEHLRGPGPHVRGCWAVDLFLGKE